MDQVPAGATSDVLKELESLDLDSEEIPDEIKNLSEETDEEKQKKAAHAFGQLRGTLKTAKEVIQQQAKELEEAKKPSPQPAQAPASQGTLTPEQQSQFYLGSLQTRAMNSLGVYDPNNPLVQMEVQRIYNEDMAMVQKRQAATQNAESVIEDTLKSFSQLADEDKVKIRERISSQYDVLQQADPKIIQREVHTYLGENIQKFRGKEPKPGEDGTPQKSDVSSGAAAASSLKSQGNVGVELGQASSDKTIEQKPPTPAELKKMKIVGLFNPTPQQVATFRRAEKKKGKHVKS